MESETLGKINYDGEITIAFGRSHRDIHWRNRTMKWSDLVARLKETKRTEETFSEYLKLPKEEQTDIKASAGAFVGGPVQGGHRKADNVPWRHLITLDADFAYPEMWEDMTALNAFACVMYSTHKHAVDKPRLRLVIPLSRPITPDEYQCVARTIAGDIGIDLFDDTTYEPHRLMFYPTTSSDAPYVFNFQDGRWLDPDEVLARYENWRDQSFWPESEHSRNHRAKLAEKQGNPLEKRGVVGAWCRTYSIPAAIERYLSDVYEACGEDRYTYAHGSSVGGLVLYDGDTFAFSHHGTDPVGGLLVNSFDLVRLHLFADKDVNVDERTPVNRRPSYLAMVDLARDDERVTETMALERIREAGIEFGDSDTSWLRRLQRNQNGQIKSNAHNVKLVLNKDPNIAGKVWVDLFEQRVIVSDDLPWREKDRGATWADADDAGLRNYLSEVYGITGRSIILDAFTEVAERQARHPVRDYLSGLTWDGVKRVDTLLIDYLGAEDSAYTRAVTRKSLTAAVARIMNPGTKFDYVLTLYGAQGQGKSEMVKRLGVHWFSDSLTTVTGKEAYEQLLGKWILELGELAAVKRAEVEAIKQFITKQSDRYRPAYGRVVTEHPRQCIFIATTNEPNFLRDLTGNRRFWIVEVESDKATKKLWGDMTDETVGQVWAEAVQSWRDGEELRLPPEMEETASEIQDEHIEDDGRMGLILEFLEKPITEEWYSLNLGMRRMALDSDLEGGKRIPRVRVCALEVWCECFGYDPGALTNGHARQINALLRKVPGWKPARSKLRFGSAYGIQKAYVRQNQDF